MRHVRSCHGKVNAHQADKNYNVHVHCYDDIRKGKMHDRLTSYLELKMLCLFYFVLESEKNSHNVGTAVLPEKRIYFLAFYSIVFFLL